MQIVSPMRFGIGIVFLVMALVLLPRAVRERGFGRMRQTAALCLLAAGLFLAVGMGVEIWPRA